MPNEFVVQHVRQYASSKGLNSNDDENEQIISYSTRVEQVKKVPENNTWTLTMRKMEIVGKQLKVIWWTEEFDAVVVAAVSASDSPWVPKIPGLKRVAENHRGKVQHSRQYRRPDSLVGQVGSLLFTLDNACGSDLFSIQNILILGGSVSAIGIANDLVSHAASVSISIRVRWSYTFLVFVLAKSHPIFRTILSTIQEPE